MSRSAVSGRRAEGYALVLLAATCWAGGGLIAKWLFTTPGPVSVGWPFPPLGIEVDPLVLSAARAVMSTAIAFGYLMSRRRSALAIRGRDLPFLAVFGVLGLAMVHFAYFKTISLTGVATAILLEYLAPVVVLVFSVALLHERLTWSLPAAVALSVGGCALMVGVFGEQGITISREGLYWGLASAVFFALAYLMNHSGKGLDWTLVDPANNMVAVLANASADAFGRWYPAAAPFLGLLAGFISGSEASSIAMLTGLHLSTAAKIGAAGLLVAAVSGIGGGLASVISPAKLQNAAASIGRIGEEAGVLRVTFVISLVITAVAAFLAVLWAF